MTKVQQALLEKVIEKAIRGGWNKRGFDKVSVSLSPEEEILGVELSSEADEIPTFYLSLIDLIYAHDFAKGLWGEKIRCISCGKILLVGEQVCKDKECMLADHAIEHLPSWAYHLQRMVISEDPLVYLKDNT